MQPLKAGLQAPPAFTALFARLRARNRAIKLNNSAASIKPNTQKADKEKREQIKGMMESNRSYGMLTVLRQFNERGDSIYENYFFGNGSC